MMTRLRHEAIVYAGDQNEAEYGELVTCITGDDFPLLAAQSRSRSRLLHSLQRNV
jgi:hypothetical protein